jgi:hypothetical protein
MTTKAWDQYIEEADELLKSAESFGPGVSSEHRIGIARAKLDVAEAVRRKALDEAALRDTERAGLVEVGDLLVELKHLEAMVEGRRARITRLEECRRFEAETTAGLVKALQEIHDLKQTTLPLNYAAKNVASHALVEYTKRLGPRQEAPQNPNGEAMKAHEVASPF